MGKLSLLAICLSIMLLGAFTFLGGFLLGMWFAGPSTTTSAVNVPVQGSTSELAAHAGTTGTDPTGLIQKESSDIGFGNIASTQAGLIAREQVSRTQIPGVPSFLTPLVTATQAAVGQQVERKTSRAVKSQLTPSTTPQTSTSPPTTTRQTTTQQPHTTTQPSSQQQTPPSQPTGGTQPSSSDSNTSSQQGSSSGDKSASSQDHTSQAGGIVPASAQAQTTGSSQQKNGKYTIQLGAYATQENADAFVRQMQLWNYPSKVVPQKGVGGTTLYYVYSGSYDKYTTALDAAAQIVSQYVPGAFVVKLPKESKGVS